MVEVKEMFDSDEKSRTCNEILRALPNWFEMEEGIVDYVQQVKTLPFYAAFDNNKVVGFVAIKIHNPFTSEIYVMGILNEYHRMGIGKILIEYCVDYCKKNKMEFLTVKTLDASRESKSYEKTRLFYLAVGFKPLEIFPLLWDENNPCLFLAKYIDNQT